MASHPQVLVEEKASVRILTLNRPKQLNALSCNMISRLLRLFLAYEEDPSVKLVILKGQGRAFCAGGDVLPLVRDIVQGKWILAADFIVYQYTLNFVMATYSKAQVSILNGIVMGGGAGLSIHGFCNASDSFGALSRCRRLLLFVKTSWIFWRVCWPHRR